MGDSLRQDKRFIYRNFKKSLLTNCIPKMIIKQSKKLQYNEPKVTQNMEALFFIY